MTPLGWFITVICVFVGVAVGYFLFKYFPNLFGTDKKINEVIKDPHLLAEKLKTHGNIYDMGKELDIEVGTDKETGKDAVMVKEKETKKAKEIQKKVEKEKVQTKKKLKKGKKKKGKK